jgi:hypothetical protein
VSAEEKPQRNADQDQLPEGTLPTEALQEGWISLFDGRSLFGWTPSSVADWHIEDGTIVVSKGEKGLLCTTTQFADYVLTLEFMSDPQTNSGIFLRTPMLPQDPSSDCYELNVAPAENPFPTGSFVGRQKNEGGGNSEGWRKYEVRLEGTHATVILDGKQVLDYTDPQPLGRGFIGLQLNEGRVAFRNIRLKPLGMQPMFDGKSLNGWKTYPDMASKFTVTADGWLNVKNGKGQLESEKSYANFVMQLQCRTNAPQLNSGVFFRCIPGQQMNGYECQIHNGYKNGDRTQPVDGGTGAIFRRQAARVVAANDQQPLWLTIAADGPHVATWVNGLQVTEFTDERPAHENPREGLRLEPGTIILQGHDEKTNVDFRDLMIYAADG